MHFELIDTGWDKVLDRAMEVGGSPLRIICPFIKLRVTNRLLRKAHPKSIQVLTRYNLRDFYEGVSDTEALHVLLTSGASIRGVRDLHAKLYLFGQKRVVVTSANLTGTALSQNHEFGFVADEPAIIARCQQYFERLWKQAGPELTLDHLDAWGRKLTEARTGFVHVPQNQKWPDYGARCGMPQSPIVISPIFSESPRAFVKFFGESHNRADWSTAVFHEVERSGCHWACTYPNGKRPRAVNDGSIMFMARLVKTPRDTIIFGRAVGMRYVDGRDDATAPEIKRRPWKVKWPHYVRVHHPEFIAGTMANGVLLSGLMDVLGSNAFVSTKRHVARGDGNTDPRKAFMQQAAVELTPEAYQWVNTQIEEAFEKFGKIPLADIDQLDRPDLVSVRG